VRLYPVDPSEEIVRVEAGPGPSQPDGRPEP
jgi:hypothetical protein